MHLSELNQDCYLQISKLISYRDALAFGLTSSQNFNRFEHGKEKKQLRDFVVYDMEITRAKPPMKGFIVNQNVYINQKFVKMEQYSIFRLPTHCSKGEIRYLSIYKTYAFAELANFILLCLHSHMAENKRLIEGIIIKDYELGRPSLTRNDISMSIPQYIYLLMERTNCKFFYLENADVIEELLVKGLMDIQNEYRVVFDVSQGRKPNSTIYTKKELIKINMKNDIN